MQMGIELFAQGIDPLDVVALERRQELALGGSDAFHQILQGLVLGQGLGRHGSKGAGKIVGDLDDILGQGGCGIAGGFLALTLQFSLLQFFFLRLFQRLQATRIISQMHVCLLLVMVLLLLIRIMLL